MNKSHTQRAPAGHIRSADPSKAKKPGWFARIFGKTDKNNPWVAASGDDDLMSQPQQQQPQVQNTRSKKPQQQQPHQASHAVPGKDTD
jgi:hypothetical protein